jgi:hypothetical protein
MRYLKISFTLVFILANSCSYSNRGIYGEKERDCRILEAINFESDSSLCWHGYYHKGSPHWGITLVNVANCQYDTLFVPLNRIYGTSYAIETSNVMCYKIDKNSAHIKWGDLIFTAKADSIVKLSRGVSAPFFIVGKNFTNDNIGYHYIYLMNADSSGKKLQIPFHYFSFEKEYIK